MRINLNLTVVRLSSIRDNRYIAGYFSFWFHEGGVRDNERVRNVRHREIRWTHRRRRFDCLVTWNLSTQQSSVSDDRNVFLVRLNEL